jgi:hypothetical protein
MHGAGSLPRRWRALVNVRSHLRCKRANPSRSVNRVREKWRIALISAYATGQQKYRRGGAMLRAVRKRCVAFAASSVTRYAYILTLADLIGLGFTRFGGFNSHNSLNSRLPQRKNGDLRRLKPQSTPSLHPGSTETRRNRDTTLADKGPTPGQTTRRRESVARGSGGTERCIRPGASEVIAEAVEVEINDGRRIERKHLAEDQAAGDSHAQRPA